VQAPAEPVEPSIVQELPSMQLAGQLPSQVSPDSTTPLPHLTVQSLSLVELQPGAQQPSPPAHWVIALCPHASVQAPAEPLVVSAVQALPSSQLAGQLPSQVSPVSTAPLPHRTLQSLSLLLLQLPGQHPSAVVHEPMGVCWQTTLHACAVPVKASAVQAFVSVHVVGQLPSHFSPVSTTPLPHVCLQS
jgi:hypothetical protein